MVTAIIREGDPPQSRKGADDTIMGGDPSNPTWEDYVAEFKDDYVPYIEAARKATEDSTWMRSSGGSFCNEHYFEFDDEQKSTLCFSWRAWGDFMQAIVGKCEGYMAYYM